MKATVLLEHLRGLGVTVTADGDQLVLDAPASLLTPALVALATAAWWTSDAVRWQQLRAAPYPPRPAADDEVGWARFCADLARDFWVRRGAELDAYAAAEAVRAAVDDDDEGDDDGDNGAF